MTTATQKFKQGLILIGGLNILFVAAVLLSGHNSPAPKSTSSYAEEKPGTTLGNAKDCSKAVGDTARMAERFHKRGVDRQQIEFELNGGMVSQYVIGMVDILNRNQPQGGYTQSEYNSFVQSAINGACSK
jgi:hypothetical protein